jgi:hypothetical protein
MRANNVNLINENNAGTLLIASCFLLCCSKVSLNLLQVKLFNFDGYFLCYLSYLIKETLVSDNNIEIVVKCEEEA